jgi:hypothetical protein
VQQSLRFCCHLWISEHDCLIKAIVRNEAGAHSAPRGAMQHRRVRAPSDAAGPQKRRRGARNIGYLTIL